MIKNVYSVEAVNRFIANIFRTEPMLQQISVKGEVSNLTYHYTGHVYFTIKDEKSALSCMMYKSYVSTMKFRMKEGDKVVVTGQIGVFERDGKYQLYAKQVELDGIGDLYLRFEALKHELADMGMFAPEYKRPIPRYVKRVGVVTASTGAVIQDIRNVSFRRNPYVQIILSPAQVQGEGAKESIVHGIKRLEKLDVDVIIVGRGGGSIEDLWAFNEECVARAIFDCPIPVISAVGHETDFTIADFVADMRASTPSMAAELAVFDYYQTKAVLEQMQQRMNVSMYRKIQTSREKLAHKTTRLKYISPQNRLQENRRRLMELEIKLSDKMRQSHTEKKHHLMLLANTLEGNSPVKKISSGYAYVENKGKSIKSIDAVHVSDEIKVYVSDGTFQAVVSEVTVHL